MTLTTDRLREIAEDGFLEHGDAKLMARELLANREAQPVAWHFPGSETESAQLGYDHELDDEQKRNCVALYTAPPAPAVPDKKTFEQIAEEVADDIGGYSIRDCIVAALWWNACRAAKLAQPVSGGYKLPEGYKLMPLEMTDEIGEAIAMEARCCGGIALCIYEAALAAAPEGGNG